MIGEENTPQEAPKVINGIEELLNNKVWINSGEETHPFLNDRLWADVNGRDSLVSRFNVPEASAPIILNLSSVNRSSLGELAEGERAIIFQESGPPIISDSGQRTSEALSNNDYYNLNVIFGHEKSESGLQVTLQGDTFDYELDRDGRNWKDRQTGEVVQIYTLLNKSVIEDLSARFTPQHTPPESRRSDAGSDLNPRFSGGHKNRFQRLLHRLRKK